MFRRTYSAILVILALATAIHLDWHLARPTAHHLSLGWSWHWLLAIPVFALVAIYVARVWSGLVSRASVTIVGGAIVLGGTLEPAWEYWAAGATWDWAFGPTRNLALGLFVGTGVAAYLVTAALMARRRALPTAG